MVTNMLTLSSYSLCPLEIISRRVCTNQLSININNIISIEKHKTWFNRINTCYYVITLNTHNKMKKIYINECKVIEIRHFGLSTIFQTNDDFAVVQNFIKSYSCNKNFMVHI